MQKQVIGFRKDDVIICLKCSAKNPIGGEAISLGHGTFKTYCTSCKKSIKMVFHGLLKQYKKAWQEAAWKNQRPNFN